MQQAGLNMATSASCCRLTTTFPTTALCMYMSAALLGAGSRISISILLLLLSLRLSPSEDLVADGCVYALELVGPFVHGRVLLHACVLVTHLQQLVHLQGGMQPHRAAAAAGSTNNQWLSHGTSSRSALWPHGKDATGFRIEPGSHL